MARARRDAILRLDENDQVHAAAQLESICSRTIRAPTFCAKSELSLDRDARHPHEGQDNVTRFCFFLI